MPPPTQQVIQRVLNKTWELCAGVLFLEGEAGWEERRWGVQSAAIWPELDVSAPRTATRRPSIPGTTTDCLIIHTAIISTVIHTTNNNPHYARKIDLYHCIYTSHWDELIRVLSAPFILRETVQHPYKLNPLTHSYCYTTDLKAWKGCRGVNVTESQLFLSLPVFVSSITSQKSLAHLSI